MKKIILLFLPVLIGCASHTSFDFSVSGILKDGDVFLPWYWHNGEKVILNVDSKGLSSHTGLLVENDTIYTCGSFFNGTRFSAFYTINGKEHILSENNLNRVECSSIFLYQGDIYIAGIVENDEFSNACYWKNDSLIFLSFKKSIAEDIFIEDGSIYVSGYILENGKRDLCYWHNGEIKIITDKGALGGEQFTSISKLDDKIVFSSTILDGNIDKAFIVVDDAIIILETPTGLFSYSTSMKCLNSNIYVTGYYNGGSRKRLPCYWENETLHTLEFKGEYAVATSIMENSGQLIVGGYYVNNGGIHPCIWINEKFFKVDNWAKIGKIEAIGK